MGQEDGGFVVLYILLLLLVGERSQLPFSIKSINQSNLDGIKQTNYFFLCIGLIQAEPLLFVRSVGSEVALSMYVGMCV